MIGSFPQPDPRRGQVSADRAKTGILAFARAARLRDADGMTDDTAYPARPCQDCYPSLTLLPGLRWTGHFFAQSAPLHRRSPAVASQRRVFRFRRGQKLLNWRIITTLIRGSLTCVNSFFWPLFPPRLPLVLPMTASAPLLVPPPVQPWPRPPMATFLPVQSPAVPLVPFVTKSPISANKTAAAPRRSRSNGHPGHSSGGRFAFCRPRIGEARCSRRS